MHCDVEHVKIGASDLNDLFDIRDVLKNEDQSVQSCNLMMLQSPQSCRRIGT